MTLSRKLLTAFASVCFALSVSAQPSYGDLPPIHVDGNQLRDAAGNKVVLHGYMDTPSPYFNSNRWGNSATDGNVSACVNYFNKMFTATTDSTQGAYAKLFRLHLDPCWTNDNAKTYAGFTVKDGKTYDPTGQEVSGEANIIHYNGTRLTKYLKTLYWKIAQASLKHGMYVIMRPPGVCPGDIYVDGYYQEYLMDVWDRVTQNDSIKKYWGHISIELANEPVRIRSANGAQTDDKRFHDFFQPIVDKIRANGFKGIIWVAGAIWQQEYKPYAVYPITDELNNIGYAVHDYPGWYGLSDSSHDPQHGIDCFRSSIPVVRTCPIVITEIDWSPEKSDGSGHYNESGTWVPANYGTWATASTSKWGLAFRETHDYFGNLSMTLSGSDTYYDWNTYKNSGYKTVKPAFPGVEEACGETCFKWYAEWAKVNYPSFERYQEPQAIPENPFELSKDWFNPHILYEGSATHGSTVSSVIIKKGGCAGWRFDDPEGIDVSKYATLKLTFSKGAVKNTFFRIYDNSGNANYFGDCYQLDIQGQKEVTIDLHNLVSQEGKIIDPTHIRIAGIVSLGADQTIYLKSATLEGSYADGISSHEATANVPVAYYNASGVKIAEPIKGMNIVKYSDGTTKKIMRK